MAQVPLYDGNQVKESAIPDVKVNPGVPSTEAFGGGAQKLLGEASDMFARAKKEADDVAAQDFDNKLAERFNADLFDDKEGALNLKGEAALFKDGKAYDLAAERGEKFEQHYKELRKNLHGANQIAAAEKYYTQRKMAHSSALEKHQASQFAEFSDNTDKASLVLTNKDIVTNYFDANKRKEGFAKLDETLDRFAARNNIGKDQLDAMRLTEKSKAHMGVLQSYLKTDQDGQAASYFKNNRGEFDADDLVKAEGILQEGAGRIAAQRNSDNIISAHPKDMVAAMEKANKLSGKLRDDTVERVKDYFSLRKAAQAQVIAEKGIEYGNMVDAGKDVDDIQREDPEGWNSLSISEKESVKGYAKKRRDGDFGGNSNYALYLERRDEAATNPTKFLKRNLIGDFPELDKTHRNKLIEIREGLLKGKPDMLTMLDGIRKDDEIIKAGMASFTKDPNPRLGTPESERVAKFRKAVDDEVMRVQDSTGKKVDNQQLQEIVDKTRVKQVFVDKAWARDPKLPVSVLTDEERGEAYVPYKEIPRGAITRMENIRRSKGKRISEQVFQRAYAAFVIGDMDLFNAILGE